MNKNLLNLTYAQKIDLIYQNKYLNVFINDSDCNIRYAVARQNYGLDILINDSDSLVSGMAWYQLKYTLDNEDYKKILLLHNI